MNLSSFRNCFLSCFEKMITNLLRPLLLLEIWLSVVFDARSVYSCDANILRGYNASFGSGIILGGNECRILHHFKGKFAYSVKLFNNGACDIMCEILYQDFFNHQQYQFCDDTVTIIEADVEGISTVRLLNPGETDTEASAKFCLTISYLAIYPSFPFELNCGNEATTDAWVVITENNPSVTGQSVTVDEDIRSSDRNRSISESERRPDAYQPSCVVLIVLLVVAILCILVLVALLIYFRRKWKSPHHKAGLITPGVGSESINYVSETPNSGIYTGLDHATHYQDPNGHYTALHQTNRPASYLVPATYQDVK